MIFVDLCCLLIILVLVVNEIKFGYDVVVEMCFEGCGLSDMFVVSGYDLWFG